MTGKPVIVMMAMALSLSLFAQEDTSYQKSLKVYLKGKVNYYESFLSLPSMTRMGSITAAYQLTNTNGHFHEFELNSFSLQRNRVDSPFINTYRFDLGLGYEKAYQLLGGKMADGRLNTYLGYSFTPNYSRFRTVHTRLDGTQFVDTHNRLSLGLAIVPRITVNQGDRIFIDLNMPIALANWDYERGSLGNRSRVSWNLGSIIMPRIGIGVRF